MKVPEGWAVFGVLVKKHEQPTPSLLLLQRRELPTMFCIARPEAKGGWRYRNEWAATTAFTDWNGVGAPSAGEWMDFP